MRPPTRFKKVVLPVTTRTRLTAEMVGENVDANAAFVNEDAERARYLAEILAKEAAERRPSRRGPTRCRGCGDRLGADAIGGRYCSTCQRRPDNRRLERAELAP